MGKVFYIFAIVTLCAIVRVHSLECYVCSNCTKVSANDLKSCDATVTTTGTPTNATTTAPANATTTPSPPTNATSAPTNATTAPANATTTPSAPTNVTSAPENVTSAPENVISAPENVTSAPENVLSAPANASTATNTSASEDPSQSNSSVQRKKRSAKDGTSSNHPCICENGKCECTDNRLFRAADMAIRAVTYQCYKHVKTVDGAEVVDRGCQGIPDGSTSTACNILNITDCKACGVDKCNSALSLQIPIALVISAFCLSFI